MRPDLARVAAIVAEIANREIAPHYRRLRRADIKAKASPGDLVTIVDENVEKALHSALSELTPSACFVGEEASAADPEIAAALTNASECWVVDPLDGTRNFVNGVDEFGTIVAYVEKGETKAGWIYAVPMRAMAVAAQGEGSTWRGEKITVKPQQDETPYGLRSVGWLTPEWKDRLVAALKTNVVSRSGHCSAYAYLKLFEGDVDFKLSSRIHAWDHAAGALILAELGGKVRWLDNGEPYAPGKSRDAPLLATAPGRDWDDIARRLLA